MISRRAFSLGLAAAPLALPKAIDSRFRGVWVGAQSYSFRDRSLDEAITAMQQIGIGIVELWSGHVEPKVDRGPAGRDQLRKWRLSVPLDDIRKVRAKLDAAGIELYAFNYSFRDDFTDAEIERGFEFAKALKVSRLTASSTVSVAKRIAPVALKHKMTVGMHNHSRIDPNEFATPESFAQAMAAGPAIGVNLDIGHYWAANFDPVDYLKQNHQRIVGIHLKDRKKNQGPNLPFGEGDTPIKECLRLIRDRKWKIPAMIEYEYKGADTVAEVRKCFEYAKSALLG